MRMEMFSIFDLKSLAFVTPFFLNNTAMALRAFNDCATDKNHMFNKHPEDYVLYRIGAFDDATAGLEVCSPPENLGLASQVVGAYGVASLIPGEGNGEDLKQTIGNEASIFRGSESGNTEIDV